MIRGLHFTRAEIKGFGSILDQQFSWGIKGLNIIKAPNGYGKTKFINALVWCLYGKTLTGSVETWEHVRNTNFMGTMVSQEFSNNGNLYKVVRCKDYSGIIDGAKGKSRLILYTNGKPDNRGKAIVQRQIELALGYSLELFKNSIIFGQKLKRIISETGPNKKRVLEEAFEMVFISNSKKYAETQLVQKRGDKLKQSNKVEILKNKLSSKREILKSLKESITNFETQKVEEIKLKNLAILKQRGKIQELEVEISKYEDEGKEYNDLCNSKIALEKNKPKPISKDKLSELSSDLKYKEKLLANLRGEAELINDTLKNLPDKCFNCNKPYTKLEKALEEGRLKKDLKDNNKKATNLSKDISSISRQISALNTAASSAEKVESKINILDSKIRKLEANIKYLGGLKDKLSEYKQGLVELMGELEHIKAKVPNKNTDEIIKEIRLLRGEIRPEKTKLSKLVKEVDIYEWLVKDPLSNSGLKAFIFNEMLDSINSRLTYYAQFIGFQVEFTINLESHNKDLEIFVYQGDYPVPYDDLSGGQQQSVDIASAFAIHDIVSGSRVCSLLVMDELFESLDKNNIEILTELIQDKANEKCLYLVTHRNEFAPTNSNTIEVSFNSGITSIKNKN